MSRSQDNRRRRQRAARKMREWRRGEVAGALVATCPHGHDHVIITSMRNVDRARRLGGARFAVCPEDVPAMQFRVTV